MLNSDFAVGKRLWLTRGLPLAIVSAVMFPQAVLAQITLDVTEGIQAQAGAEQVQTLVSKASVPQGTLPHTVLEVQGGDATAEQSSGAAVPLSVDSAQSSAAGVASTPAAATEPAATTAVITASTTTTAMADTGTAAGNTSADSTNSTPDADSALSGSLIGSNNSDGSASANPNDPNASVSNDSAILAAAEATPNEAGAAVYADSMIKPNRPNGLLYSTSKADATTQAAPDATATTAANNSLVDQASSAVAETKPKSIVVFFSVPEQVERNDVDSLTGASVIEKDNQRYGITEYVARYIGQKLDTQVYELHAATAYPQEHSALIERAAADLHKIKSQDFSLETKLEPAVDLSQVDTIYLGFPLWWNDLPLPVYAFLESTDLSGKTLVPFCTMGGNVPYQLFKQLNEIEPNAKILRGLEIKKHKLVHKQDHKRLDRWLEEQGSAETSGSKPNNSKRSSS